MWSTRWSNVVLALCLLAGACQSPADDTTTTPSQAQTTATTTTTIPITSTTESQPVNTLSFDVPKGDEGVTFQEDGDPPSGPSSYLIMSDGSVVIADTMAAERGDPRLLHFDRTGEPLAVLPLNQFEVASIVDITSDGSTIAVLDVFAAMDRYRVLILSTAGEMLESLNVPEGFRFENGLTGLLWDDIGILLEFELGSRYARLTSGGAEPAAVPILGGTEFEIRRGEGRVHSVRVGESSFEVEQPSDLGGVSLVGLTPDGNVVLVMDEVDTTGPVIRVVQHVHRYHSDGTLVDAYIVDVDDQFIQIARPWELGADGAITYLASLSWGVRLVPESMLAGE